MRPAPVSREVGMRPPNKPLERAGVIPCADITTAIAGRSAPRRRWQQTGAAAAIPGWGNAGAGS
jgi:hypothetical protein